MLYTNWVAVDLLRQLKFMTNITTKTRSSAYGVSSKGSVAATFTVTYWGLLQASLQLLYCLSAESWSSQRGTQRRYITLILGLLLPSLMGVAFLYYVHFSLVADHEYDHKSEILPTLYYDGINQELHGWTMLYTSLHMAMTCPVVLVSLGQVLWTRIFRSAWKEDTRVALLASLVTPLSVMYLTVATPTYMLKAVFSGGRAVSQSCFFMPCAP